MKYKINKNSLAFSISTYTLINIINKGIPFLLLPVLTHYLDPTDYGILTNVESLLTISITLIGINLSSAVTRQYVKKDIDMKNYVYTGLRVIMISFFLVTIIYSSFASFIYEYTGIPLNIIYFVSIYSLLDNVMETLLAMWRMEDKPLNYGVFRICRTIIEIGLSVMLVVAYQYDWFGRFIGIYIGGILSGVYALFYLYKKGFLSGKYISDYKTHFLKYGLPLIPHSISGVIILYSDKIVITKMLGLEDNGIYSVAFQIGMAISLLQNSFNQAWVPWLFKKLALNSENEKRKLVKITYLYMLAMLGVVIVLWLITPLIYYFLGDVFSDGMELVTIIGLGFAFNGMYKMMVNYLFYAEKTKFISIVTIGMAVFNIGLNIVLIDEYGLIGSAYSSALTFFLEFVIIWYFSQRVYPMPWFKFR